MADDFRLNGVALRVLREHLGWSVNRLANAVGISRSHLSRAERNQRELSKETALRIAVVLGMPLSSFTAEREDQIA